MLVRKGFDGIVARTLLPVIRPEEIKNALDVYAQGKSFYKPVSPGIKQLKKFYQTIETQKTALKPEQLCELISILSWKPADFDPQKPTATTSKTDVVFKPLQAKFNQTLWPHLFDLARVRPLTTDDLVEIYNHSENEMCQLTQALSTLTAKLPYHDVEETREMLYSHPAEAQEMVKAMIKLNNLGFTMVDTLIHLKEYRGELNTIAKEMLTFYQQLKCHRHWDFVKFELNNSRSLKHEVRKLYDAFYVINNSLIVDDHDYKYIQDEPMNQFSSSSRFQTLMREIASNFDVALDQARKFEQIKLQENPWRKRFVGNGVTVIPPVAESKVAVTTMLYR